LPFSILRWLCTPPLLTVPLWAGLFLSDDLYDFTFALSLLKNAVTAGHLFWDFNLMPLQDRGRCWLLRSQSTLGLNPFLPGNGSSFFVPLWWCDPGPPAIAPPPWFSFLAVSGTGISPHSATDGVWVFFSLLPTACSPTVWISGGLTFLSAVRVFFCALGWTFSQSARRKQSYNNYGTRWQRGLSQFRLSPLQFYLFHSSSIFLC